MNILRVTKIMFFKMIDVFSCLKCGCWFSAVEGISRFFFRLNDVDLEVLHDQIKLDNEVANFS